MNSDTPETDAFDFETHIGRVMNEVNAEVFFGLLIGLLIGPAGGLDYSKPVRTSAPFHAWGRYPVRILCLDGPDPKYPVIGIIGDHKSTTSWTLEGKHPAGSWMNLENYTPSLGLEEEIELAKQVCVKAHAGQFRRDGVTPYHTHPFAVANAVPDELKPAAYLHDVLEDTQVTLEELTRQRFSERTLKTIEFLTRKADEAYDDYLGLLCHREDAVRVKIADMEHNLSCQPSENSIKKINKWLPILKNLVK